jgi:hypothetical protein
LISTGGCFRRSDIVADALCALPGAQAVDQHEQAPDQAFPGQGLACFCPMESG